LKLICNNYLSKKAEVFNYETFENIRAVRNNTQQFFAVKYLLFFSIVLTGCRSSYNIPSQKYGDNLISTTKSSDGTTTNKFMRHDLTYVDIAKQNKLLERKVFDYEQLVYRYPILRSNIKPGKIFLRSGHSFLSTTLSDTLVFVNDYLPVMNRHFWAKGVVISTLTDSSYLVKTNVNNNGYARFYISVSDNYEEVKKGNGFISDSLVLPIR
jgi:hypothetical protein